MATMETMAQAVARLLHEDGQCWTADDGTRPLDGVETAARYVRGELAAMRHVFADGSVILEACGGAGWWDLEADGRPWVAAGAPEDGEIGAGS